MQIWAMHADPPDRFNPGEHLFLKFHYRTRRACRRYRNDNQKTAASQASDDRAERDASPYLQAVIPTIPISTASCQTQTWPLPAPLNSGLPKPL
jgi:hypothetical protein